jgi:hypothetical protein
MELFYYLIGAFIAILLVTLKIMFNKYYVNASTSIIASSALNNSLFALDAPTVLSSNVKVPLVLDLGVPAVLRSNVKPPAVLRSNVKPPSSMFNKIPSIVGNQYDYEAKYRCDQGVLLDNTCSLDSYKREPTTTLINLNSSILTDMGAKNDENNDIRYITSKVNDPYPFEFRSYGIPCTSGYTPIKTMSQSRGQRTNTFYCASDTNTSPATLYCNPEDILKNGYCSIKK